MANKPPAEMTNYEVVPLASEWIGVAAVQMNPEPVNPKKVAQGIKTNLDRMMLLCDRASSMSAAWGNGRTNLVVFPEFTITGYDFTWNTADFLTVCLDTEGPEVDIIGQKARERDLYIAFASHFVDKDWPGHYFNCSMIVAPSGKVIHKHWKAYMRGPGFEFATSVHDVMDEFIAKYGIDACWPVARTPIGNLATYVCSEGFAPETARAFTFKGAEILCRCIGGGGPLNKAGKYMLQFRADCAYSDVYGVFANGGSGPGIEGIGGPENGMGGGSMIVDPFGRIVNQANDSREQIVFEMLPIAAFRKAHERPYIRTELYATAYEQCPGKYPPNMYTQHGVPESATAAIKMSAENARW
jgi:predicted amidohydrolase